MKRRYVSFEDINQMQNNTGTRINGLTPYKSDIIKRLNKIVDENGAMEEPMYDLQKSKYHAVRSLVSGSIVASKETQW